MVNACNFIIFLILSGVSLLMAFCKKNEIEHDSQMSTSYTLYNREAVERLLRDDPDLLPQPKVKVLMLTMRPRERLRTFKNKG